MTLSGVIRISKQRSQGVAIIIFVTILLLAATTLLVSELSPNQRGAERVIQNAANIALAKDALVGYAVSQAVPGTLPCPDTSGDGFQNTSALGCQSNLGLLPYRTLDLPALTDTSGARLWLAVDPTLVINAVGVRNSSVVGTLTLDAEPQVAIVIAPGKALGNQERRPLVRSDFLEGVNADANLADYARPLDDTENDQLAGISTAYFWSLIQVRVLKTAVALLNNYRAACLIYPFAANFGGPYVSINLQQFGSLPLLLAQPFDWGSPCPLGNAPTPPAWLATNWSSQLLYRFCTPIEGNCVTIINHVNSPSVGVVVAPGIALPGQNRPGININDYFEPENSALPNTNFRTERPINHTGNFNDIALPL